MLHPPAAPSLPSRGGGVCVGGGNVFVCGVCVWCVCVCVGFGCVACVGVCLWLEERWGEVRAQGPPPARWRGQKWPKWTRRVNATHQLVDHHRADSPGLCGVTNWRGERGEGGRGTQEKEGRARGRGRGEGWRVEQEGRRSEQREGEEERKGGGTAWQFNTFLEGAVSMGIPPLF